jgi:tRNA(Ile)-lysidine synthetase-like protein
MDIFAAESGTLTALADNWVRGQGWKHPGLTISTGPQALKASRVFPGRLIAQSTFDSLPLSLQRRCIQQQLIALGVPTDFTLVERLRESPGKALSAAKGLSASSAEGEESASRRKLEALPILVKRDETGEVSLVASRRGPSMFPAESAVFRLHGRAGEINFAGAKFNWRIRSASGASRVRAIQGREVFDAERIGELVRLRHWQPGDRFQPIGMHHSVKLQDLFTNAKIPQDRRHRLVVAEGQDDGIFWVEGLRIGDKYKLSSHARRVLIWRYST